ncbi:MAG: DUF1064 domain-containing protein [Bacteroides sp.]
MIIKRAKGSKYKNKKVETEFGTFDSKKEHKRFLELQAMQDKSEISSLQRQVKYELIPAQYETTTKQLKTKTKEVQKLKEHAINYYADFQYVKNGETVVEDVKASKFFMDGVYKIKKKLMLYVHGITINEIF